MVAEQVRHKETNRLRERDKWCSAPPRVVLLLVCLHWQAVDTDLAYQPQRPFISLWWMGLAQTSATLSRWSHSFDLTLLYSYVQLRALCCDTWTRLDRFEECICERERGRNSTSNVLFIIRWIFIMLYHLYTKLVKLILYAVAQSDCLRCRGKKRHQVYAEGHQHTNHDALSHILSTGGEL